jgi:hypothetical protein
MWRSFSQIHAFSFLYRFPKINQDANLKMGRTDDDDTGEEVTNGTLGRVNKGPIVRRGPKSKISGLIEPANSR